MMKFEEGKKHREAVFEEWQKIRVIFLAIIIALLLAAMLTAAFDIGHGERAPAHSLASPVEVSILSKAPPTQWNKTYGGTDQDWPSALVQASDGGYAIAGSTYSYSAGLCDVLLIKTDAYGNTEWNKTYGGPGSDWASALVQASDGGFAMACSTLSYGAGSADTWVIKLVIPEFPFATILLVLMALITLTAAFVKKKRFQENRRPKSSPCSE